MKILMASMPATGRINPLLAVGHVLMAEHDELVVLSGSWRQGFKRRHRALRELGLGPVSLPLFLEGSQVCAPAMLATAAGEARS
jgi:hypothetical protein